MNDKKLLLPVPPPQENKPQLRSVSTSRVLLCFHVGFGEGSAYQFTPQQRPAMTVWTQNWGNGCTPDGTLDVLPGTESIKHPRPASEILLPLLMHFLYRTQACMFPWEHVDTHTICIYAQYVSYSLFLQPVVRPKGPPPPVPSTKPPSSHREETFVSTTLQLFTSFTWVANDYQIPISIFSFYD